MSQPISVIVVSVSPDLVAEFIAAAVARRPDIILQEQRVLAVSEVCVDQRHFPMQLALIVVGDENSTKELAHDWLCKRSDLIVVRVEIVGDAVQFELRNIGLDSLLAAVCELGNRTNYDPRDRVFRVELDPLSNSDNSFPSVAEKSASAGPLLNASINWIHTVLRNAVEELSTGHGDLPGLTVTAATVAELLDAKTVNSSPYHTHAANIADMELLSALNDADRSQEPLATAVRIFNLCPTEFRVLLLALAPELDPRYQRCFGLLLDDLGRRVPTLGLCATLIGQPSHVRQQLALAGNLTRWRLLETRTGGLPPADEALRIDPYIADWLLGGTSTLALDEHTRRITRMTPWPGAAVLQQPNIRIGAATLIRKILNPRKETQWLVLGSENGADWRALLELGSTILQVLPIRAELTHLTGTDPSGIEECALRLGRMGLLTGRPVIMDLGDTDGSRHDDEHLRAFLGTLGSTGCTAALISPDKARIARLLGPALFDCEDLAILAPARTAAAHAAARHAELTLTEPTIEAITNQYPLQIDGFERAMLLACSKSFPEECDVSYRVDRFVAACKEVAGEHVSHFSERIEPVFELSQVVLPQDRKQQLLEIVQNVHFAAKVLDEWNFRKQLLYGRGVTALFHGPSGTGKTMAAIGVAHSLGVQVLRLDLSRVVSKYIGETEKNIDCVFSDAQKSGAAILIDEADALLGKRSEVKDAHDRYANIEVAYLLQRMEAYEGLVILTTNLRQNLDAAFLRRLRFIIDFPRPDAIAREDIWRRCLPENSHQLDAAAFRLLARKVELTGGHIRQITLRAAFLAAAADKPIGLDHIVYATNAEFAKLGMPAMELNVPEGRRAA